MQNVATGDVLNMYFDPPAKNVNPDNPVEQNEEPINDDSPSEMEQGT